MTAMTLAGCSRDIGPIEVARSDIDALTTAIMNLGPDVDPAEAARAARISYEHTNQLAIEYEITDPPLIHNTKVNMGLRPRGLCWHWAEDMEARLKQERFETLDLHRAIANSDNSFRIEHSTALISHKGGTMRDAIVLDPWRQGGRLFWAPFKEDTKYKWIERDIVLERKYRQKAEGQIIEGVSDEG